MNPSFLLRLCAASAATLLVCSSSCGEVPNILAHQGRVAVQGINYDGTGQFKFLVYEATPAGGAPLAARWSNASSAPVSVNEPATAVNLTVTRGLFAAPLGDTSLANMAALPADLSPPAGRTLFLRVWFSNGPLGFQQLSPDAPLRSVPFALQSKSVGPGGVNAAALTPGSVTGAALAADSVQPSHLAHTLQTDDWNFEIPVTGGSQSFTFAQTFQSAPAIDLGIQGLNPADINVTTTGFTLNLPPHNVPIFLSANYNDAALVSAATLTDGRPCVAWYQDDLVKFAIATSVAASAWTVMPVAGFPDVSSVSMAVINGTPAIAWIRSGAHSLHYSRANGVPVGAWPGNAVVVQASGVSEFGCSLAQVNGNPAIAFQSESTRDARFIRSIDADGNAAADWTGGVISVENAAEDTGRFPSLAIISGNPAIAYAQYVDDDTAIARYARAADANGVSWTGVAPKNAWHKSIALLDGGIGLAQVNGKPGIAVIAWPGQLHFLRASDATGATGFFASLPLAGVNTSFGPQPMKLTVVANRPAIAFTGNDFYHSLSLVWAVDADATLWQPVLPLYPATARGVGITAVGGRPGIMAGFQIPNVTAELRFFRDVPQFAGDLTWRARASAPVTAAAVMPGTIVKESLHENFFGTELRQTGSDSFATGRRSAALGRYSVAMGDGAAALKDGAAAFGQNTEAAGSYSFATGSNSKALGDSSVAMGRNVVARGDSSFAAGFQTEAGGGSSVALGDRASANGLYAVALGSYAVASAEYTFAAGSDVQALGEHSTALGFNTEARSFAETVLGANPELDLTYDPDSWVATDRLFVIGNGATNQSTSNAMTILKDGRVGLGLVVFPSYRLHLANSTTAATGKGLANEWATYSDSRIKTDQRPLPYGLAEVMRLQPRAYTQHSGTVKDGAFVPEAGGASAPGIGFIAQEVAPVIPEAVNKPADPNNELYAVNYDKLVPVLVKAMQELKSENDTLKARIEALEKRRHAAP